MSFAVDFTSTAVKNYQAYLLHVSIQINQQICVVCTCALFTFRFIAGNHVTTMRT